MSARAKAWVTLSVLLAASGCNRAYHFDWLDFDGGPTDDQVVVSEGGVDAATDAPGMDAPAPDGDGAVVGPDAPDAMPSDVPMLPDAGPLAPPRLLYPWSVSMLTTTTPRLRWMMNAGDGVRVELCRVARCATVDQTFDVTGTEFVPSTPLAPGVWFWRVRPRMGMAYGTMTSAVWEFTVPRHSAPVATISAMVQGDFNGDGYADIAVGGLGVFGAASVTVYHGAASGTPTAALVIQAPAGAPNEFGIAVAKVGDVNNDGFGDLVIGAPNQSGAGRVYVYHGSAAGLSTMPTATLSSPDSAGDRFGQTVAPAGDVNGDGYSDVVVTAPSGGSGSGRVYVFLGGASGLASMPAAVLSPGRGLANFGSARAVAGTDFAGCPAASAGDVDGDGLSDVVVGAPSATDAATASSAFVLYPGTSAGTTGVNPAASRAITHPSDLMYGRFGVTVVALGDVDGDGYGDVGVGAAVGSSAPAPTGPSRAMYLRGPSLMPVSNSGVITGTTADRAGAAIAGFADVNADGAADFAIGIPGATIGTTANAGHVSFHLGSTTTAPVPAVTVNSPLSSAPGWFGGAVANAGDVNGDGRSDFVIALPQYIMSGESGRVYLYYGMMGSLPATGILLPRGTSANGVIGFSVASRALVSTYPGG